MAADTATFNSTGLYALKKGSGDIGRTVLERRRHVGQDSSLSTGYTLYSIQSIVIFNYFLKFSTLSSK